MGIIAVGWGLLGVFGLLVSAVYRLGARAAEIWSHPLDGLQWAALILGALFMLYSEGYKGFQQNFSPRVAARARYLRSHASLLRTVLAPLFLMGYFHATRKRMIVSYSLTLGIVSVVLLVRLLPQPWRGIIDSFVVLGLVYGIVSLAVFCWIALRTEQFDYSPEVSESER